MTYEVSVKEVPQQLVAQTTVRASSATIGKEIEEAFHRLWEVASEIGHGQGYPGVTAMGVPAPDRDTTFEVFVPVARAFERRDDIEARTIAGGRVAVTLHRGPYDEIGPAYEAVQRWVEANGYGFAGPPRELYLTAPDEVPQEQAATEVQFPIR